MGEVARLVLRLEGYKGAESQTTVREELERELSDLFVFLFKLAYQCGIDMEVALEAGQAKADERWGDLAAANAELQRYLDRQAENLAHLGNGPEPSPGGDDTIKGIVREGQEGG
jgi:hypothetical protein